MLRKAVERLNSVLKRIDVKSDVADDVMEALSYIQRYMDTKEIIAFVMEHYTTEQIVSRCRFAVMEAFAKDYNEFIKNKE